MINKKNARKYFLIVCLVTFGLTLYFLFGKEESMILNVLLFFSYFTIIFTVISNLFLGICLMVSRYIIYRNYKKDFEQFKYRYKNRYTCTRDEIQTCFFEIIVYGIKMIADGEYFIVSDKINKSQIKKVKKIINEIKEMIESL